jgi:hypothetical protein
MRQQAAALQRNGCSTPKGRHELTYESEIRPVAWFVDQKLTSRAFCVMIRSLVQKGMNFMMVSFWQQLVGIALPVACLGSYALLLAARRESFFGYYFAYASASGRRPASGGGTPR